MLVSRPYENHSDFIYFNSSNLSHSYYFPETYKIGSIYEDEARKTCMEILQLEFHDERKNDLKSITTRFNTHVKGVEDSTLIFL